MRDNKNELVKALENENNKKFISKLLNVPKEKLDNNYVNFQNGSSIAFSKREESKLKSFNA